MCKEVGWTDSQNRYYDAIYNNIKIEIKKGKIWLDLVRYSEIFLGEGPQDTITAFFIPKKTKEGIDKIFFVQTSEIIKTLHLSKESATQIKLINSLVPRSLNAQASLTVNDISKIACYCKKCE